MSVKALYEESQAVSGALWTPEKEWDGQDAFIIGGGPSLKTFDFEYLKGRNTIGCNDAFRLGSEIVQILLFGDASFFHRAVHEIAKFPNRRVTNCPQLMHINASWMLRMIRRQRGLAEGNTLGWNYSTGACAVNLALSLGAKRIFMLGFDMRKEPDGRSHWHKGYSQPTRDDQFDRFVEGFDDVKNDLVQYPQVEVFNVNDNGSRLTVFPIITVAQMKEMVV